MTYTPSSDEEKDFLASYDATRFTPVAITVDVALFTIRQGRLCVLLVKRGGYPYKDTWALPGGFVEPDEDTDTAARRELLEETGMETFEGHLEQLRTFSTPNRDPRMRVISVAYVGMMPDLPTPKAGSDAADVHFFPVEDLNLMTGEATEDGPALAFDHHILLEAATARVCDKLEYSAKLVLSFLDETFTLSDFKHVLEVVWGTMPLDENGVALLPGAPGYRSRSPLVLHSANARRKVLSARPSIVIPAGTKGKSATGGRTAELYKPGPATLIHPPLLRPRGVEEIETESSEG